MPVKKTTEPAKKITLKQAKEQIAKLESKLEKIENGA